MKKKLLLGIIFIFLVGTTCLIGAIFYHFYSLFPNSDQLFTLRHNYFSHLEFHTDRWNYEPGDTMAIFGSSSSPDSVFVSAYSLLGNDTLLNQKSVKGQFQPLSRNASLAGTNWKPVLKHVISMNTATGWYVITLKNREFVRHASIFVVPAVDQIQKKIAVLLSTNTWNAYNHWGGKSLYTRNYTSTVSFFRPQPLSDPFIQNTYANYQWYYQAANKDRYLTHLLDSAGFAYDVYSESELERSPEKLSQYKTLISSTHSEYWSWQMMIHLNDCLDVGVSWLCLSGNTAGYVIDLDLEKGTEYVNKYGGGWESCDKGAALRPFGTFYSVTHGFHTYAPYRIQNDSSWVWKGIKVEKGQLFGKKSDVYDYTYMTDSWLGNLWNLTRKGNWGAASGMEIDRMGDATPGNWVQLAQGLNPPGQGEGEVLTGAEASDGQEVFGADMGYYQHRGGGIVFHASSIAFVGAIPFDAVVRQLLVNLVVKTIN